MSEPESFAARNHLKEKLDSGKVVASMIVRMSRGADIARIAKAAGFDALYVDMEHSSLSLDVTSQICMTALDLDVTPLVRVPGMSPEIVCQVLDGGAMGIIVPAIANAADARRAVESAKYPPLGNRSVSGSLPQFQYRNVPIAEANAVLNQRTFVGVMIESESALNNVEQIAAVDGVDLLHVGMSDLATSLGMPGKLQPADIVRIFATVLDVAKKHGKHVGIGGLAGMPDLVRTIVRQGASFVSAGTDLSFLLSAATERARFIHGLRT